MLFIAQFLAHCAKTPDKILFEFSNDNSEVVTRYTYAEFELKTRIIAQNLVQAGYKHECALLVYPPGLDFILAFTACLRAGVIAVPVYPPRGAKSKDLSMFISVCTSCNAKLALTNSAYNWATKVMSIKEVLLAPLHQLRREEQEQQRGKWPETLHWLVTDTFGAPPSAQVLIDEDITAQQVAFLQYTSGSTALPKGVSLTHGNLAHNLTTICTALQADASVQVVSWLPMYHDMGLIGSHLGTMYCGGSALIFSPISFVKNPVMWLELVSSKRATHLQAPNFAYRLTCRKFTEASAKRTITLDLSSVKHCFNAAEPIDATAMEEFCTLFGQFGFKPEAMVPGYGLAEHTVYVCDGGQQRLLVDRAELEGNGRVVVAQERGDAATVISLVGLGHAPPDSGVHVLIVDPSSREKLEEDCVGEIWVTSASKSDAYFGMPELTQRDLHAKLEQEGAPSMRRESSTDSLVSSGRAHAQPLPRAPASELELSLEWLRTGDLGFIHKGELFVCGRIKDLIIVRGRNHFPQDLEQTVETCAGAGAQIRPGCVGAFALEDESVIIVAEMRQQVAGATGLLSPSELCDAIKTAVANEHGVSLAGIVLIRERTIPKTTSGKLSRHRIRNAYLAKTLDVVHEWKTQQQQPQEQIAAQPQQQPVLAASTPEEVLLQLKREVVSLLELEVADAKDVDETATMHTLGFDSMMLTQLKGAIINVFQVEVEDEVLYDETCTLLAVQAMVVRLQAANVAAAAAASAAAKPDEEARSRASSQQSQAKKKQERRPWIASMKKGQKCGFCGC